MKKLTLAFVFACLPFAAMADKIDLSTTTCGQFLESDKTEIMLTLAWLDAYYKDVDAPPVIDTDSSSRMPASWENTARPTRPSA